MRAAFSGIVGMRDVFRDGLAEVWISRALKGMNRLQIPVENVAAGQVELSRSRVQRQIGNRKIVANATADVEPVGIEGSHRTRIRKIDLTDERADFVHEDLD
jgi:hypothetical protein